MVFQIKTRLLDSSDTMSLFPSGEKATPLQLCVTLCEHPLVLFVKSGLPTTMLAFGPLLVTWLFHKRTRPEAPEMSELAIANTPFELMAQ
jgi:hypothetical protein